jgi:sulfite exporter TauE/SafE
MSSLTPFIDEGLSSIPGIFCVYMCDGILCLNQSAVKKKKKKESASTTAVVT